MLSDLRLVKTLPARLDIGGKLQKPRWVCKFSYDGRNYAVAVFTSTYNRPLGQDIIDAMSTYIRLGVVTEDELLDIKIIE